MPASRRGLQLCGTAWLSTLFFEKTMPFACFAENSEISRTESVTVQTTIVLAQGDGGSVCMAWCGIPSFASVEATCLAATFATCATP